MVTTRSSDPRGMRNNVNEDESVSTADNSKLLVEGNTKRKKNSKVTMTKNVKSPDALDELGGESLDAPDVTTGGDETMTKNDKIPTPPSTMTKTVKSRGFPSNEKVNLAKLPDALDVPVGNELPTKPILSSGASQLPAANSVHSVKTMHQSKEVPKGPILSPVASVEILETSQSPAANSVVFVKSTPGKETPNVEIVELPPWKRSNKPADLEAPPIFMTEMDQGGAQRSGPTDFYPEIYRGSGIRQFSYPVRTHVVVDWPKWDEQNEILSEDPYNDYKPIFNSSNAPHPHRYPVGSMNLDEVTEFRKDHEKWMKFDYLHVYTHWSEMFTSPYDENLDFFAFYTASGEMSIMYDWFASNVDDTDINVAKIVSSVWKRVHPPSYFLYRQKKIDASAEPKHHGYNTASFRRQKKRFSGIPQNFSIMKKRVISLVLGNQLHFTAYLVVNFGAHFQEGGNDDKAPCFIGNCDSLGGGRAMNTVVYFILSVMYEIEVWVAKLLNVGENFTIPNLDLVELGRKCKRSANDRQHHICKIPVLNVPQAISQNDGYNCGLFGIMNTKAAFLADTLHYVSWPLITNVEMLGKLVIKPFWDLPNDREQASQRVNDRVAKFRFMLIAMILDEVRGNIWYQNGPKDVPKIPADTYIYQTESVENIATTDAEGSESQRGSASGSASIGSASGHSEGTSTGSGSAEESVEAGNESNGDGMEAGGDKEDEDKNPSRDTGNKESGEEDDDEQSDSEEEENEDEKVVEGAVKLSDEPEVEVPPVPMVETDTNTLISNLEEKEDEQTIANLLEKTVDDKKASSAKQVVSQQESTKTKITSRRHTNLPLKTKRTWGKGDDDHGDDDDGNDDLSLPDINTSVEKQYPDMTPDGKFFYELKDKEEELKHRTARRRLRMAKWREATTGMDYEERKSYIAKKRADREARILEATRPQREALEDRKRKNRQWKQTATEVGDVLLKTAKLTAKEKKAVSARLEKEFPDKKGEKKDKQVTQIAHLKYIPATTRAFTPVEARERRKMGLGISGYQTHIIHYYQGLAYKKDKGGESFLSDKLNYLWVRDCFDERFVSLVKEVGIDETKRGILLKNRKWIPVPIGDSSTRCVSQDLEVEVKVHYQQGEHSTCLFRALASAFHHIGCTHTGSVLASISKKNEHLCGEVQLKAAIAAVRAHEPLYKKVDYWKKQKVIERQDFLGEPNGNPKLLVLRGCDGGVQHAVAVVGTTIFDSNREKGLTLSKESLDWCCNCNGGFSRVQTVVQFRK
jgi:hypothetical protein